MTICNQIENMFQHIKEFYDTYSGISRDKSKGGPCLIDFELDLSLLDLDFLFKSGFYYEIRYRDPKYNTIETISYGGCYKIKIPKGKSAVPSSEPLENRKAVVVEEGAKLDKLIYDKKVVH